MAGSEPTNVASVPRFLTEKLTQTWFSNKEPPGHHSNNPRYHLFFHSTKHLVSFDKFNSHHILIHSSEGAKQTSRRSMLMFGYWQHDCCRHGLSYSFKGQCQTASNEFSSVQFSSICTVNNFMRKCSGLECYHAASRLIPRETATNEPKHFGCK